MLARIYMVNGIDRQLCGVDWHLHGVGWGIYSVGWDIYCKMVLTGMYMVLAGMYKMLAGTYMVNGIDWDMKDPDCNTCGILTWPGIHIALTRICVILTRIYMVC